MSARSRLFVALSMIVLLGIPTLALTLGQPPADPLRTLELPELPEFTPPKVQKSTRRDAQAQQQIGEAIQQGRFQTGNPDVDEVLELIQRKGSILANSSLDPAKAPPEKRAESASAKARAAECLLKAARILEKIDPTDETRLDLVNQMRRESVRLLTP